MRTGTTARGVALTGAALLALTACGGGGDSDGDTGAAGESSSGDKQVQVYGTDGNIGDPLGEQFEDPAAELAGVKGTTPLTDLSDDFKQKLLDVDPDLG